MISLFKVFMSKDVDEFTSPVLHSGYIGEGEKVQLFEKEISRFIKNENVVAVNSGTAAITMALRLAGVGYGDYVASTAMTCLATNMPILSLGAIPIWVDVNKIDGTMNPKDLELKINTANKKPKAILCMDWGGLPCDLSALNRISKQYRIPLIEDACQAIGSVYNNELIGNHADFVCFSFQAIKHITSVEGGALVINGIPDLVKKARLMRWFGLDRTQSIDMRCNQDPPVWGYKFHQNDVFASIGLANLRYLPWILSETRKHANIYNNSFTELKNITVLPITSNRQSNYWLYTLLVHDVDNFIKYMKYNNIECSRVHDRNDIKQIFKNFETILPGVSYFDKHHVCIPVGWWLTNREVDYIITTVRGYNG